MKNADATAEPVSPEVATKIRRGRESSFDDFLVNISRHSAKKRAPKSLKEPVKNLTVDPKLKPLEQDLKAVTQAQTLSYGRELTIQL